MVKVSGAGFPAGGYNVTGVSTTGTYPTNAGGGYIIPLADTMANFAAAQAPPATLSGQYTFLAVCRTGLNATDLGNFDGSIWFTSPTKGRRPR